MNNIHTVCNNTFLSKEHPVDGLPTDEIDNRQCDKKGFADRRPRQPDRFFCQGTLCVFCAHIYVTYYLFLDISYS